MPLLVRDPRTVPPIVFGLFFLGGVIVSLGFGQQDLVLTVFGALLSGRLLGGLVRGSRSDAPGG